MPLSRRDRWVAAFGRLRLFMGGDGNTVDSHSRSQDRIMHARDALDRKPERPRATRRGSKIGMEAVVAHHLVKYAETHFDRGDRPNGQFALDEAQRCEADAQMRRVLGPLLPEGVDPLDERVCRQRLP